MSFPLELFLEQARIEKRSPDFIRETRFYAERLMQKNLPVVFSIPHFAMELGIRSDDLKSMVSENERNYTYYFLRKKRKNSIRQIMAPKEKLKHTQRWINFNILQNLEYSEFTTGFLPGTCIKDNAERHLGKKYILKIDLLKFFDSITHKQVYHIFKDAGYVNNLAHDFASICTAYPRRVYWDRFTAYERKCFKKIIKEKLKVLPQGAPTSPLLANLVAGSMDREIGELSAAMGFTYSRYADDLCFSSNKFHELPTVQKITQIIERHGFYVNPNKVHFAKKGQRQYVTGLSINGSKVSVKKEKRKEIFKHLYFAHKYGVESHLQHLKTKGRYHQNFKDWIFGHISYHYSIDKRIGMKMMKMYNKINWVIDSDVSNIDVQKAIDKIYKRQE